MQVKKWNAKSGFLILPYQSRGIAASFPVEDKMAAIRRLALFNALLDLVDDEYQLSSKHIDNSVLLSTSASNEKKERQQVCHRLCETIVYRRKQWPQNIYFVEHNLIFIPRTFIVKGRFRSCPICLTSSLFYRQQTRFRE